MAVILENKPIEGGFFLMRLPFAARCLPGQFVMLRIPGVLDPFLGRPISVFDWEDGVLSLLYQVVGKGTRLFSTLQPGQTVEAQGPYGNGFPVLNQDYTLIGGGVAIAPLYLLAKAHRQAYPDRKVELHLGFREQPVLEQAYRAVCHRCTIDIGGFVTDTVDFSLPGRIYCACGPTPMMRAAATLAQAHNATLYVSLEERMACGVGACLGCTCQTASGNKRACKDGPVFLAQEVFPHA